MGHSSAVGFVVFTLCLVACVCASAEGNGGDKTAEITENDAQQAVSDAQNSIKQVSDNAQTNLTNTQDVLQKVESSKKKADKAAVDAKQAAKDNSKAKNIVDNIITISTRVTELHDSVKGKLDSTIGSLENVVSEANKLKEQLNKVLPLTEAASKKYSEAKAKALEIKGEADKLDTNITEALKAINGVSSTTDKMEQNAKDAELKSLQVSGIVAVAQIDTMMKVVDGIIQTINIKKEEVNGIFQEMRSLKPKPLTDSIHTIDALLKSGEDALTNATGAVQNATKAKEEITAQQQQNGDLLGKVNTATSVEEAQKAVDLTTACVRFIENSMTKLNSALERAENSVKNASVSNQEMVKTLSTTTTKPSTQEVKETEKSDPLVGDSRAQPHQKEATSQSTITEKEQTTSKDSTDQTNNSADKLNDALITGAQNVPTTALDGEKAPAPGAKNDSAMTVSVPLLVALIASAVLQ